MTPTSWPFVKALSWAVDVDEGTDVDEGINEEEGIDEEEEVAEVNDEDELVEVEEEVEEIDVAVLVEDKIEAELDKEVIDVVGVAVVVKDGIAVVVSGVEATDDEAGEVEPPNVHNDPNGIYSRRLKTVQLHFCNTYAWTKVSQW